MHPASPLLTQGPQKAPTSHVLAGHRARWSSECAGPKVIKAFKLKREACFSTSFHKVLLSACFFFRKKKKKRISERISTPQGHTAPQTTGCPHLSFIKCHQRGAPPHQVFCLQSICRLIRGTRKEIGDISLLLTSAKALSQSTAVLRGRVNVPTKTSRSARSAHDSQKPLNRPNKNQWPLDQGHTPSPSGADFHNKPQPSTSGWFSPSWAH